MAFEREQEAYELTASSAGQGTARSGAGSYPNTASDAAARRSSEVSREIVDDANSDDPISDDNAKTKEKDGKEQQAGLGDYFVRESHEITCYLGRDKLTRARKYSPSVIA